jgi:ketosteroid isomerase-like protein
VDEKAEFLEALVARMKAADDALHSGNAGPRKAMWSTKEPVTVFGAAMSATGPVETQATFDWVASRFTRFESAEWEILSADVSGDLAYVVAIEHTTVSIGGAPTESYSLRATTILRREDGEWRAIHRHADPVEGSVPARYSLLGRLVESTATQQAGRACSPSTC